MVNLLTPKESIPYARDYLDRADLGDSGNCIGYENLLQISSLPSGIYVFTGINRLGQAWAELLSDLHDQITAETGFAPLNHPLKTLRRLELLQALNQSGMNNFRAFGAWEDLSDLRFPVFVRPREQDGGVPNLLRNMGEIEAAVGKEMMAGWSIDELLVIEFEDTSDETGLYRKYSAYIVGDQIVPVSVDWGSRWVMRSGGVDENKRLFEEEMRFVEENPHEEQLRRVFSISNTQFGRIDYSVKEDRVQTWEINTLPLLRRPRDKPPMPAAIRALREPRRRHFKAAFTEAWRALIANAPNGPGIRIAFDQNTLARAESELESKGVNTEPMSVPYRRLRRLLRPIKPLLKPVTARVLHPLLGKRARRAEEP